MKVLITGASGLVGHQIISAALRRGHDVIAVTGSRKLEMPELLKSICIDLSRPDSITQTVLNLFPDAIINAAAVSNPADVLQNPELAEQINVSIPKALAQIANHISAPFVHISTDLVFDGQRGKYTSTDQPNPLSLYGEQKLKSETEVLEAGGYFSRVLRIPIQMGNSMSTQRSVHERLFQAWSAGKTPSLFTDEIRQPCSASSVADVIIELIERNDLHGIFHWSGAEAISRYEMGARILKHFGLPESLIQASSAKAYADGEPRPLDLTMINHPLEGKIKTEAQTFEAQLEELVIPPACREWYHSF